VRLTNDIFGIALRNSEYLAARHATLARNIANADTPGFTPSDLLPFSAASATDVSAHLTEANGLEVVHSGNGVDLERELLAAGETARQYAMNTAITRAFHRLALAATKA